VIGHPDRLKDIAKDIVNHFEVRQKVFEGKAIRVAVRNVLRRYGYPLDLAKMEADRVVTQSESLAEIFSAED